MMETEAKEKRKRRVKKGRGAFFASESNRGERREGGRRGEGRKGKCHGWIPVDYDRNNGIRIIKIYASGRYLQPSNYHNAWEGITMAIKHDSMESCA